MSLRVRKDYQFIAPGLFPITLSEHDTRKIRGRSGPSSNSITTDSTYFFFRTPACAEKIGRILTLRRKPLPFTENCIKKMFRFDNDVIFFIKFEN